MENQTQLLLPASEANPTAEAIIEEARRVIAHTGWSQNANKRNLAGEALDFFELEDNRAVCFCLHGALVEAADRLGAKTSVLDEARWAIARRLNGDSFAALPRWNDNEIRARHEVVQLLGRSTPSPSCGANQFSTT